MAAEIVSLPTTYLTDDERQLMAVLRTELHAKRFRLQLLDAYFEGEQLVRDLGISIPPQLKGLHTVIGWPRIGVEALEQRLDLEAFAWGDGSDGAELREIADHNDLFDESSLGHTDALVYGSGYIDVGSSCECGGGSCADCPPLMSIESPLDMALMWDARVRMGMAALREVVHEGERMSVLKLPDRTIWTVDSESGPVIIDRDDHGLGVLPVLRLANRQRTADRVGRSEITSDVMSITDAACRRLLGIEVAAEFFGAPQRYLLGVSESAFQAADGTPTSAWETYLGRIVALERDEDGNVPEVGQFAAHDPSGQTKIIDLYARIMATQLGLPPHMLGYTSDNPASADAIRSAESMLVKKAERRIRRFGRVWAEAMRMALWVRDGEPPDKARRIETVWRNPATPTLAAQVDATVKLVTAGILPADSDVALELAGLNETQRQRVRSDRRRSGATALLEQLGGMDDLPPARLRVGEADGPEAF